MHTRALVVMFVREPIPGTVKTRLVPALGAVGAAALYRAFVEDACARLAPHVPLALACSPAPPSAALRPSFVAALARRYGLAVVPQGEGDLGARMRGVAAAALATVSRVVLIGSDVPTLPVAHVTAALRALRPRAGVAASRTRIVLGPSLDGGYCLLGVRAPVPDVFTRVPWSSDRVLARTLARLRRARITPALLPPWYDVDTAADVEILTRHLALLMTLGEDRCPRTRRVLARARRVEHGAAARRPPAGRVTR